MREHGDRFTAFLVLPNARFTHVALAHGNRVESVAKEAAAKAKEFQIERWYRGRSTRIGTWPTPGRFSACQR